MKTTSLIPFTATLAACAAFGASNAAAAAPSISSESVVEGTSLTVQVSHLCNVKKRCTYNVSTTDGTAKAGADYTPATAYGRVRKGHLFQATMPVDTVNDGSCESDETLTVRVAITTRKGTKTYTAPQTITDDDCETPQTPDPPADPAPPADPPPAPHTPNPPVAIPANPDGATVSGDSQARSMSQDCTTKYEVGQRFNNGTGFTVSPCYVWAQCPASAAKCAGFVSNHVDATTHVFVLGYGKPSFYDANGTKVDSKAYSCRNNDYLGSCGSSTNDIPVAAGQTVVQECDGFYDPTEYPANEGPPLQPGARVQCSVQLTW